MTKLASLRNRLDGLRRRRQTARWGTGYSALVSSLLVSLIVAFIVDYFLAGGHLGVGPRIVLLLAIAGTAGWAFFKFTAPFLGQSETTVDMALLVEGQQLDPDHRDLVAAMQFESPEAQQWGSQQLETAVIDYVVEFGQGLDVYQGFSREQMTRRISVLAVVAAIVGIGIFTAPQHASVFLNRLLLGSRHYPTKTQIEQIAVNDVLVLIGEDDGTQPNNDAKGAQGRKVTFAVRCSGELPDDGSVTLFFGKSAREESLVLTKLSADDRRQNLHSALKRWSAENHDADSDGEIYIGQLERLSEGPIQYTIALGDAWTDPAELRMIPLPLVEVQSKVTPPKYAAVEVEQDEATDKLTANSLDVSVLEGSRVELSVNSSKPLKTATVTIESKTYELKQTDEAGKAWHLVAKTPLSVVREPIKYAVQVTDQDDLQLEHPKQGFVGLRADRPPTIVAGIRKLFIKTDHATPAGGATLTFDLTDDHGIVQVLAQGEIIRRIEGVAETIKIAPFSVLSPSKPLLRSSGEIPKNGASYRLYVGSLKLPDGQPANLQEGDKLQLRLAATDYRGEFEGRTSLSDTLILTITDDAGLIKATLASDRLLERQLNAAAKFAGKGDLK